jgi:hypothetical protein
MKLILRIDSYKPKDEPAGGLEVPSFGLLQTRRPNFKYTFLASACLHFFGFFVLPPLVTYIPGFEDEKPNNVEVVLITKNPEELRLILPPRSRPRPRKRAAGAGAPSMGRAGAAPSGGGSPKPRRRPEPVTEEPGPESAPAPPEPKPVETAQAPAPKEGDGGELAILIQPPERVAPPEPKPAKVPSLSIWTGPPEHLTRREPVTPGVPEPPKLTAAPAPPTTQMPSFLDNPAPVPIPKVEPPPEMPKLPLRSAGAALSMLRPAQPPKPETPAPPPAPGDQMKGAPAAVISISSTPAEPGKEIVIPPGNRMELGSGGPGRTPGGATNAPPSPPRPKPAAAGGASGTGQGKGSGAGSGSGAGKGAGTGRGPAGKGGGGSGGGTGTGTGPGSGPGTGTAPKGTGTGTSGTGQGRTGSGPAGTGTGSSGLPAGPGGAGTVPGAGGGGGEVESSFGIAGGTVRVLEAADGSRALNYPADGYFDVIVLETKLGPGLPSAEDLLAGRPIHTAYLNVGLRKEWILQYCVQGARQEAADSSSGIVSLAPEPTLKAPFVRRAFLPRASQFDSPNYLAFVGVIGAAGHVQSLRAIGEDSAAHQALLPFLSKWAFRPATEDDKPVPIEFVLVIPSHTNR